MEEKNEFSDLILDDQNNASKAKKLLLNVIVAIIVILIAIVGYKIFSQDSASQATNDTDTSASFMVSKDSDSSDNSITITQQGDDDFDGFKSTKLQDVEPIHIADETSASNPESIIQIDPKPAAPKAPIAPAPKPAPVVAQQAPKPEPKQDVFDTIKVEKPSTKSAPAKAPSKPAAQPSTIAKGAYVQVLAGKSLDLNSKEIKNIKEKGFDFVVYQDPSTNIQKLLIGPLSGGELESKLNEVRAKIKKDAFIFRVK